ncbi:MAG TPA: EAL domain-containing protein [Roseiarcus sp.]|jgi:cyclic-di-GMP phosphodiesterase TipF (flagellum assembly factor)|nr:EAL domain-containing protein [Roseiarcus sp.]
MVRVGAIFVAACMVLIAASVGAVLLLRFGLPIADAALIALGVLSVLAIYNAAAGRRRDRAEVSDQVSSIARGSGDLARQLAEFGRRLGAMESKVEKVLDRALSTSQPLAAEIEELSRLVKELAEAVAAHDAALGRVRGAAPVAPAAPAVADLPPAPSVSAAVKPADPSSASPPPAVGGKIGAFGGLDRDGIVAVVRGAIESQRVELYLQPIVTLPQRKVRYYEAMSRLNIGEGEIIAAADFLPYAETGGLLPKLDGLSVLRCVQVVRRLLLKNRDVGLFCNLSAASLSDASFPQLLEFVEANRAIAPSLVFEFSQSAVRAMGPLEHEAMAALAERGFRFSMDNLSDLRVEPRELTERGFRFVKAPAMLLLNRLGGTATNIHPADFSDLLGRFGIDLVAVGIESESTVVDLLDYDVRFGQGFLFSPPRPVRAEALQTVGAAARSEPTKAEGVSAAPGGDGAPALSGVAQLARMVGHI